MKRKLTSGSVAGSIVVAVYCVIVTASTCLMGYGIYLAFTALRKYIG